MGHPVGRAVQIHVPLTQSDLASLLGAARTSVNRILNLYEEQGLIRRLSRRATIVDVDRLLQRLS
jgi:CRP-like cAMP-binding protein